jgi:hypothetical protein
VRTLVAVAAIALLVPAAGLAKSKSRVYLEDTVPSGSSSAVTFTTHRAASFSVRLRVPTAGRAKLFLLGKNAPKGGPLIHTSDTSSNSSGCQGAAGSFYCLASFEPLPKGTYTWRITWVSVTQAGPKMPAHVELTVRW